MKKIHLLISIIFVMAFSLVSCGNGSGSKDGTIVELKTTAGKIKIKLYDETPKHRDNFIKLAKEGYYDGMLFHRVIKDFMIQTGDPNSKNADTNAMLGTGGPGYTIEAEINKDLIHKRGAIAAARQGDQVNPEKESSGSQFYIVQGRTFTEEELTNIEEQMNMQTKQMIAYEYFNDSANVDFANKVKEAQKNEDRDALMALNTFFIQKVDSIFETAPDKFQFTDKQKQIYSTLGGAPHLDGNYTVFGEVIEGIDIVDKIGNAACDESSKPLEDIKIISVKVH